MAFIERTPERDQRPTNIENVGQSERSRATSIQLMAFSSDPVMRWMWPEPDAYVRNFPELVRGFGGRAFETGTAHATEDFQGGALWSPPGVGPDEAALEALMRETVAAPTRAEVGAVMEQMAQSHPSEPHWHLTFIGVDPVARGRGIGAALLAHGLAAIDESHLHAYLESSNPRNVPLYQRHGFEVVREIQVGNSPLVIPMVRVPR